LYILLGYIYIYIYIYTRIDLIRDWRLRPRSFVEGMEGLVISWVLLPADAVPWQGRDKSLTDGSQ
jgi:hypothetical protein